MPSPESALTTRIMKAIKQTYGQRCWVMKVHGHAEQAAGVPDIIGTVDGYLIGIEVKLPDGTWGVTRLQEATLLALHEAGAISGVAHSPEEALEIIAEDLAERESDGA